MSKSLPVMCFRLVCSVAAFVAVVGSAPNADHYTRTSRQSQCRDNRFLRLRPVVSVGMSQVGALEHSGEKNVRDGASMLGLPRVSEVWLSVLFFRVRMSHRSNVFVMKTKERTRQFFDLVHMVIAVFRWWGCRPGKFSIEVAVAQRPFSRRRVLLSLGSNVASGGQARNHCLSRLFFWPM